MRVGRVNLGGRPGQVSGAGAWTPKSDSASLLWWDPSALSSGLVSTWTDKIAGVSLTGSGATRPTQSATAISSAYPGVTSDGGDILSGAVPTLSGRTTVTIVCAMVDATASANVCLELTADVNTVNGGLGIYVNDGAAPRINGVLRGVPGTGPTNRSAAEAISSVKIVSVLYDFATAGANAINAIRVNGTSQALTTVVAGSAPGSAANDTLYLFARAAVIAPWPGTFGDIVFRNGISTGADLDRVERWMGARCGLSW